MLGGIVRWWGGGGSAGAADVQCLRGSLLPRPRADGVGGTTDREE